MLLKDLVLTTSGPFIDVLILHYGCSCCKEPFGVVFLKSVPSLISYDVICVEILHLNNFARLKPFGLDFREKISLKKCIKCHI